MFKGKQYIVVFRGLLLQLLLLCTFFSSHKTFSQLQVNTTTTANQLTNSIVGDGVRIINASLNCPNGAFATFTANGLNLGVEDGVLLTSGSAEAAIGPNSSGSQGVNNGAPGDNQLDVLSGATTFDACVLEIDLIPTCDTLRISYVFGSEEYPEFVGREFNDVFAFFVSGPGITGVQNVALIPNTITPVSVNSINATTNNNFYINNIGGDFLQYDGYTTVLEGKIAVQPCSQYKLKLAVADVVDGIYESGVFIQGNSVKCSNNDMKAPLALQKGATEGCEAAEFSFERSGDLSQALTYPFTIEGSATAGVDYTSFPSAVSFAPGQSVATVSIDILDDGEVELDEVIEVIFQPGDCPIFDTIRLTIKDKPILDAGPDVELCSGTTVKIGDKPVANATYLWSPTTGLNDPTLLRPTLKLNNTTNADNALVYVQTATFNNCVVTDTVVVKVKYLPQIDIVTNSVCLDQPANFVNTAYTADIVEQQWNYGDNFVGLGNNIDHQYASPGNYRVVVQAVGANACVASDSVNIEVYAMPTADFDVEGVCQQEVINFKSTSSTDATIFGWNFGGGAINQNTKNPSVVFNNAGAFNVTLNVENNTGCTAKKSQLVRIRNKPVANFGSNEVCFGEETIFDQFSTVANSTIANYEWLFAPLDSSQDVEPIFTFDQPGSRDVRLIVSTAFGCSDTVVKPVLVNNLPIAKIATNDVCLGSEASFTDLSVSNNSQGIKSWIWNFDFAFINTNQNPTINLADTGKHYVELTIETFEGCKDTILDSLFVLPNPSVNFNPVDVCEGELTNFSNLSTNLSAKDSISTFIWNFGDGSPAQVAQLPSYVFGDDGIYDVTLTAVTDSGCSSSFTKQVAVHSKPVASFTSTDACLFKKSSFQSTSTVSDGFVEKLYWNFNDLGLDSLRVFTNFEFSSAGSYPVTLAAVSNFGCADSITKPAIVNPNPSVELENIKNFCLGKIIDFEAANIQKPNGIEALNYLWSFGDGSISNEAVTQHQYQNVGTFNVSLTVTDVYNCTDTVRDSVVITNVPEIKLVGEPFCTNANGVFYLEIEPDTNFNWTQIEWDFGDGNTAVNDTFKIHHFDSVGFFKTVATLTSDSGCVVDRVWNTSVYAPPSPSFFADTVCLGNETKFVSTSAAPPGSFIAGWKWVTPDGSLGSEATFNYEFEKWGFDSVELSAVTNNGCRDTVVQSVFVRPAPVVDFDITAIVGCAPFCVSLRSEIQSDEYEVTSIRWDLGNGNISVDTNPEFCFEEAGRYSVELEAVNQLGCKGLVYKEDLIKINQSPVASFVLNERQLSGYYPITTVTNTSYFDRGARYFVSNGDSLVNQANTFKYNFENPGTYLINQVVENEFGCRDTFTQGVVVSEEQAVYIPNAFTPTSTRGLNDIFFPVIYGKLREADFTMRIYNRWGQLMYKTNDSSLGWDGTYLGRYVKEDVYVYTITLVPDGGDEKEDGINFNGHVTLLR